MWEGGRLGLEEEPWRSPLLEGRERRRVGRVGTRRGRRRAEGFFLFFILFF